MNDIAPIIVFALVMVMIVIKQLLSHQRQMTALIHRVDQQAPTQDSQKLQQDMNDLKQLVQNQAIALDNLSGKMDALANQNGVQERLQKVQ